MSSLLLTLDKLKCVNWRKHSRTSFSIANVFIASVHCFVLVGNGIYGILVMSPDEAYDSVQCTGTQIVQFISVYCGLSIVSSFFHFFTLIASSLDVHLSKRSHRRPRLANIFFASSLFFTVSAVLIHMLRFIILAYASNLLLRSSCQPLREYLFMAAYPFVVVNWVSYALMTIFTGCAYVSSFIGTNIYYGVETYDSLELPDSTHEDNNAQVLQS